MGTSHQRSNLVGKAGTETIRGFATISATAIYGGTLGGATVHATTLNGNAVNATILTVNGSLNLAASTNYIKLGDHQYIFFGEQTTADAVEAAATAIDASVKGSLYLSRGGDLFVFSADDTAATVSVS
jgi:hypothetical protein